MISSINDIVNSNRNYHWIIDNDRQSVTRKGVQRITRDKYRQADETAYAIERKIGNTGDEIAHKLYCKASYSLAPATIWNYVEIALKGRSPARYLSWLLSRELKQLK